jgi:pimeloyl-ACP methyl ester carboxylesterase
MHSFYFGTSKEPLFGVYHAAESSGAPDLPGIVMCHPLGHEYIRAHRPFRNLAVALSRRGYHVLRFDYYGTGDSGGSSDAGGPRRAAADLDTAIDELKDMAGVSRVALIGLRVGATLAAGAAGSRDDVRQVVLWDPVLSGHDYVARLLEVQDQWRQGRPAVRFPRGYVPPPELIGFPLPDAVRAEYEQLDLSSVRLPRDARFDVVLSSEDQRAPVEACMRALGVPVQVQVVPSAGDWHRPSAVHLALLPHEILQAIPSLF